MREYEEALLTHSFRAYRTQKRFSIFPKSLTNIDLQLGAKDSNLR